MTRRGGLLALRGLTTPPSPLPPPAAGAAAPAEARLPAPVGTPLAASAASCLSLDSSPSACPAGGPQEATFSPTVLLNKQLATSALAFCEHLLYPTNAPDAGVS